MKQKNRTHLRPNPQATMGVSVWGDGLWSGGGRCGRWSEGELGPELVKEVFAGVILQRLSFVRSVPANAREHEKVSVKLRPDELKM